MRMRLRDGILGDYYIYPIYELDFNAMLSDIPGAFQVSSDRYTGPNSDGKEGKNYGTIGTDDWAFRYHRARIISTQLYNFMPSTVPHQLNRYGVPNGVDGSPLKFNTNIEQYKEYPMEEYGMERVTGGQPEDFNTNYSYFEEITNYTGYTGYMDVVDQYTPTSSWDANQKNWRDKNKVCFRQFYTGVGSCHFSMLRISLYTFYYPYYYRHGICVGCNATQSSDGRTDPIYAFCDKTNTPLYSRIGGLPYMFDLYSTYSSNRGSANIWQFFVHYDINGDEYWGIAQCYFTTGWNEQDYPTEIDLIGMSKQFWGDSIIPGGGSGGDWGSQTTIGGGAGTWSYASDSRGDTTGALATGIADAARSRVDAFFTGANGFKLHQLLPADIPDIYGALYSTSFIQRYQNTLYSPLSAVLSMHMLPAALVDTEHATTPSDLTLSGYNVSTQVTQKQYPQLPTMYAHHVGSVDIDATDTYLDYAPYTNAYLHLPYIGVLTLDINAIAAGTISVDYITDAITGNVTALITCTDRDGHTQPKYVAQGNAAYSLPMFAVNQDGSSVGKIVSSGIGVAMSALSGNAAGVMGGASGIVSGAFDAAMARSNTQITGAFSGNAGIISDTMVWLEIVRPQWCAPQHYQLIRGIPSQLSGTIQAFNDYGDGYTGYLRILDIDMDGIQATDDELVQIDQILRAGIFVNQPT